LILKSDLVFENYSGFAKKWQKKRVWVSSFPTSFRPKSALLDRMDRNSKNPRLKKCLQVHDNG
jgi:hypothetical protein